MATPRELYFLNGPFHGETICLPMKSFPHQLPMYTGFERAQELCFYKLVEDQFHKAIYHFDRF